MRTQKFITAALLAALCAAGAALWADLAVERGTAGLVFDDPAPLPRNKAGLLLGTSSRLKGGGRNPYFYNRVAAAARLYRAGKVDNLIVSGANPSRFYNEPLELRRELIKEGVPAGRIYMDYAGRRTLDSVLRCSEVFGQRGFTVISQEFHVRRAVYMGRRLGLDVVGFSAPGVAPGEGHRADSREHLARLVMFADLLLGRRPRFPEGRVGIK